jgi:DNA-binding GntR family transcriptional regulator
MAKHPPMIFATIPEMPQERLSELRARVLELMIRNGAPPDYAMPAAEIERELGVSRGELRAVHMKILTEGLIAGRPRMGVIGLSPRGQSVARRLVEPQAMAAE